ncbi:MAG: GNAT family N-acetyltransferase, partial [Pseudomonadota bacterium]
MIIRRATPDDVDGMVAVLKALTAAGLRTRPDDPEFTLNHYVQPPNGIRCSVAVDDKGVRGLQSLTRATEDNPWGVTPGWGIIGTHISPDAARQGIGKQLFTATIKAARGAGLAHIDATIGATNAGGLAYY